MSVALHLISRPVRGRTKRLPDWFNRAHNLCKSWSTNESTLGFLPACFCLIASTNLSRSLAPPCVSCAHRADGGVNTSPLCADKRLTNLTLKRIFCTSLSLPTVTEYTQTSASYFNKNKVQTNTINMHFSAIALLCLISIAGITFGSVTQLREDDVGFWDEQADRNLVAGCSSTATRCVLFKAVDFLY